jgi:hypothetical protein
MKWLATVCGPLALALTIVPPVLYFGQLVGDAAMKALMLAGAVLWFASAPWFMKGGDR